MLVSLTNCIRPQSHNVRESCLTALPVSQLLKALPRRSYYPGGQRTLLLLLTLWWTTQISTGFELHDFPKVFLSPEGNRGRSRTATGWGRNGQAGRKAGTHLSFRHVTVTVRTRNGGRQKEMPRGHKVFIAFLGELCNHIYTMGGWS